MYAAAHFTEALQLGDDFPTPKERLCLGGATPKVRSEPSDIERRSPVDGDSISPGPRFPTKDRVKSSCILLSVSSSE